MYQYLGAYIVKIPLQSVVLFENVLESNDTNVHFFSSFKETYNLFDNDKLT